MKTRKIIRRKELAATISLLLASAPAAYAQDQAGSDTEQSEETVMEEVVVTGKFRASLIDQIGTKRDNTSIVDAISAEDIGKLPDSSIAESLARLPGVSGERRNGRVSGISVRGFNENYVGTTLNGRELLGMGDNRGVEYDLYPAEIVSGMVVFKTPDATQMVQGIGGIVDIRTVRPLDTEPVFGITAVYEQNDLSSANPDFDDNGYRLALNWSGVFADDTLGIAVAAATTDSPSQEQQFRGWGYPGANADNAAPGVSVPDGTNILGGHDSFVRSATLKRDTISGVIQWAPSDDVTVTLDAVYIDFEEDKVFRGIEEGLAEWGTGNYTITGVEDGLVTSANLDGGFRSVVRNDAERKTAELKTFGLNVDWNLNDDWTLTFDGAYSEVDKTITNIESYSGVGRAGLMTQGSPTHRSWTMTPSGALFGPHPTLSAPDLTDFDLVRLAGPQAWGGAMAPIQQFQEVTLPDGSVIGPPQSQDGFVNEPVFTEELKTLRLDATRALDWSVFKQVRFGVNYSDREKSKDNGGAYLTAPTWPNDGPIPQEYRVGTTNLGFLGIPGVVAYDGIRMYQDGFYIASDAQELETGRLGDTYTVSEELTTAFLMLDFDTDIGNGMLYGNVGLQYLDVDQESAGFGTYTGPDLYVLAQPIVDGDSYSEWLPSLNMAYDFDNGHVLRFAASKTMSRPRMDDLRSNQQVSFSFNLAQITSDDPRNSSWSGSAGNARLRPLEANQLDLAWDWYFAQDGIFSAALFYKDLKNWHRAGQFIADFSDFYIPGYHQVVDENGVVQTPATFEGLVSFREDGLTGDVTGLELQTIFPFRLLWDPLDGLGMIATATFIDGDLDDGTRVPGLSDENYSLTMFYERGGFEVRVGATKRTEYLTENRGISLSLQPTTDQGATLWDAQMSYDFGHRFDGWLGGLSLALQGQNLTDEDTLQTNEDSREVVLYQTFGANYLLTAVYKFW
ncbi:MAG: TonB-dependent receptor [Xanthomonadales bacterium]|nr:TonB-dependent receptor [Xanthomonadales bacterium]